MTDLPLTGGCLCGGVRFAIDKPLVAAGYCHCTRCQRRTGTAAAASAATVPGSVRITQGEELVRTWWPPEGFGKAFCSQCGSALWGVKPDDHTMLGVRLGTFDGDPGVRPQWHAHTATAAVWEPLPDDGLPRYERGRTTT